MKTSGAAAESQASSLPVSFARRPPWLRQQRAQLCAAQPSPPFFSVYPQFVRALPFVDQLGLCRNLA